MKMVTDMSRGARLSPETLAERLLLVLYAYGTNTGIGAVAAGDHPHREDDLRYVRRRFLTAEVARSFAIEIANDTFAARDLAIWGETATTVASDSKHIGALDQNILTEWHARYRKAGVLIYWHVEKKSMAIHSQLIGCSASEVAAMIDGAMHHGTMLDVEGNYTDSHGQSQIGFGITRLLGFELLPRIQQINKVKLYQAQRGDRNTYPGLQPAFTRPIRWERIAEQYDQMIKYATAIRTRTASTEAILRRFMQANAIHPTYQAMIELGRAQKTIFVCRYLRLRELQREVEEGLNVVESWEPRGEGDLLRERQRHPLKPPRRAGALGAVPAGAAGCDGVHQHADDPADPRPASLGGRADRRGQARPDTVVLGARAALRRRSSGHGPPPGARRMTAAPAPQGPPAPKRTPARRKARQLAKHLRSERPDYAYLKQVFRHLREELGVQVDRAPKKLPYVPTEREIRSFYEAVWNARRSRDVVMIKTLLYTGVRVSELVRIRLGDVDLDGCRIRIEQGKGKKDRYVPFPASFKETLALHIDSQRRPASTHLFESSWKKPYSDRGVRKILARYAQAAGIEGPISPHPLRDFLFTWLKTQGIDDALIQPYSGHASRQSLEIYSRIALADAPQAYDDAIGRYPV